MPTPARSTRGPAGLRLGALAASALLAATALTACGTGAQQEGAPLAGLRIMVPNAPGGGYDVTARNAARAMEDAGITGNVEVFNLAGAGGTVGLARVVGEAGNGELLMSMGLGVVGASFTNDSEATLAETTPIARLTQEADAIVVAADSPYQDLGDLLEDWRADPGAVAVGGGSSPGGPDHLAPMLTAEAAGIDPADVNYISYDGGGELLAAVLGGQVAFGVSGAAEFMDQIEAGELRVLAVTSAEPAQGLDGVPTLQDEGLDVDFVNWRGLVAPPGLDAEDEQALSEAVEELHGSQEWKDILETNGWTDAYLPGAEFGEFMDSETRRVDDVLTDLGLL
ncbi:Bug family tripartite tricarboxylate transporter substrate binding protein [Actinorugispora endophytica]|uniref:Putative tricarboxylic transport membrane protein n=1 Tax=Actinorugispora endophytica TaxID=1605990 RepID=A0A4R6V3M9_9ACTN|nr:tripartite tricarboxylate transporter substrate binding protein [Actinorugispora endophytica]TDQ53318.1 putative tricarboxylic transport membrane protein [Actinorugispora endophytica]